MKKVTLFLGIISVMHVNAQFVDYNTLRLVNGKTVYTAYQEAKYFRAPSNNDGPQLRVIGGKLEESMDGDTWLDYNKETIDFPREGNWNSVRFLSNLVFLAHPTSIETTLDSKSYLFDIPALHGHDIFEVGSSYKNEKGKEFPYVSVFARDGLLPKLLSSFIIKESNFQFRIGEAIFLNRNVMIIFAETEDPGVNFIVLYDVEKKSPIGFKSFDEAIFLPQINIIGFSDPLPSGLARTLLPGAVEEVPIFTKTNLSPLLTDNTLLEPAEY